MTQRNLVNSIIMNIPVMAVVNRDILSLNAQIMKSKKRETSKGRRREKTKKAYIAWDDKDVSSSSSSDDEEANLCLLALVTSSVDSTSTSKGTTYDQLLNAFYETHDEANLMAFSCVLLESK